MQEFYRQADKIMRPETAREAVYAGRSTPIEAPRETAPSGKSLSTEKNGATRNKKVEIADDL